MGGRILFLVLLLPLAVGSEREVTLEKTIESKPDVTPACTNESQNIITLVVCKINTKRSRGEECRLLYEYEHGFVNECDTRFTLLMENQTLFLHLTELTQEDSGSFNCECSRPDGTYILHLNITVEDSEDEDVSSSKEMLIPGVLIGVTVVIIITGVILGYIHRRLRHGLNNVGQAEALSSQTSQDPEPYSIFVQRQCELYSTVTFSGEGL